MIHYLTGDATQPITADWVIVHVCNNVGAFGKGFAAAIGNRYPCVKHAYLTSHWTSPFKLGEIQVINITPTQYVINMVAQDGLPGRYNPYPLSFTALEDCLYQANIFAYPTLTIHMPRIGTGYARGKWEDIEPIIQRTCCVDVFVYDL